MPITFSCGNADCRKPLKVRDEVAGKRVRCPECGAICVVPAAEFDERIELADGGPVRLRRTDLTDDERLERPNGPYRAATFRRLFTAATVCFFAIFLPLILAAALYFIGESKPPFPMEFNPRTGKIEENMRGGDQRVPYYNAALLSALVSIPLLLASIVLFLIFLYKAWNLIQDGRTQTTPAMAVGYLFIPFFNIYWLFTAYPGLASATIAFMERHRIAGPRPSAGLGLTYAILTLVSAIPFVGIVTAVAAQIVLILFMNSVKNAAIAIIEASEVNETGRRRAARPSLGHDG